VSDVRLIRGNVYWADAGFGRKPYLVVSNSRRNTHLRSALVVRLTTTPKPPLDTIVELTSADVPLVGRVMCDDFETLEAEENVEHAGALSPRTMLRVDDALRVALAL
jgi:mRNA interferase MazF